MIRSIRLINWRSHSNSFLQFKKGTNLLIGSMGSGKSSVLDGVSFALFGTFPMLERRRVKLADIVKAEEQYSETILEIVWEGQEYKIMRKIVKKREGANTEAKIAKNGKLIDEGSEIVTNYVENLLNVNYDLFTRAIYSEQNNIDYFLSIDPRRRKEEIDRLLGLDRFETVRANTTNVLNRVRDERKAFEQKFNRTYLNELMGKRAELEKRLNEMVGAVEALTKEIDGIKKEMGAKEIVFKEIMKKKENYDRLSQEIIRLQTIIERLEKEIKDKEFQTSKLESLKKDHEQTTKEKNDKQVILNELNALFASLSTKKGSLEMKNKMALTTKEQVEKSRKRSTELLNGKNLNQLKQELTDCERELLELHSELKMLNKTIEDISKITNAVSQDANNCPFCGSALSAYKIQELIEEKSRADNTARERVNKLKTEITLKEKITNAMQSVIREVDGINAQLTSLRSNYIEPELVSTELFTASKELDRVQGDRTNAQNILNELNKKIERQTIEIVEYEQRSKKKTELERTKELLDNAQKSVKELCFDPKNIENVRSEFEMTRIEYERKTADKRAKQEQINMLSDMRMVIEKDMSTQIESEKNINELLKVEDELTIYKNLVLETQLELRNEMIDGINAAMAEIWTIFYPHRNYSEIKLVITEKDYELQVFNGQWKTLESMASGGERACAALTLRVAMAMVLTPNLSWLILDEPTHNLDKDAVELLSNTLQYKIPEVVQQTFVITHDEALAGSEFASSYRLSRDKALNNPTTVEVV